MEAYSKVSLDIDGINGGSITEPYVWGATELLKQPAIGICGSRKASENGLQYANELGRIAADVGVIVVSGYAAGVDQKAHMGALEAGGATIAVLPEGIDHFSVRTVLRPFLRPDNFLALSQFEPSSPWTSWRAMQRNKTIISLVGAMFVVEAGESGGTFAAGLEALRLRKPLFVLDYKTERPATVGNKLLIQKGAIVLNNRRGLKEAFTAVRSNDLQKLARLI